MKTLFISLLAVFLSFPSFAQLEEGFKEEEAKDLIALCNSFTFLEVYNSDKEILPPLYQKKYTSGIFGMDNKYQIYQKEKIAVINLRGSTSKKISWLENIYSAMIPAKGIIEVSGEKIKYCFAKDTNAAVHAGYALGIAFLSKDILYQINTLNKDSIYHFIITGHSQGGALANMLRAYLENLPEGELSEKNRFKTYAFAAPMVGNKEFVKEYNSLYCSSSSSFNIVNLADLIPTLPLNYNDTNYVAENLKTFLFEKESFSLKKMASDGFIRLFEKGVTQSVNKVSYSASEQISKDLGPVVMPDYVKDINYHRLNKQIEIKPAVYPKILKDSSILENDSLMTVYARGEDGHFLNDELYVKEPFGYQHKPYNYYLSILEMYFPKEYLVVRRKALPE